MSYRERERDTHTQKKRGLSDIFTCKWLFTCANVRSLTSMSSRTDFGVAPETHSPNILLKKKKKKKPIN